MAATEVADGLMAGWWPQVGERVQAMMDFVVWRGADYALTLGALLTAALMLCLAALCSGVLGWLGTRNLPARLRKNSQAVLFLQRGISLLVWVLFIFWTLSYLGIPLTTFAFLGGALALGFGFGAQNICSNMISGLILMMEHPYRVGDTLEVEGKIGKVRRLGLRATEIRLTDGVKMLVPNSYFLANTIYNRSTRASLLRGSLSVGVAYASNPRKVEELLLGSAKAHPAVLSKEAFAPWVIFDSFGASAMGFTLYFWVDTTQASLPQVGSDLRHHILTAFREAGIAIPFPQMDVHLNGSLEKTHE